jgi:DNA-binding transcriptional LysR family regulator
LPKLVLLTIPLRAVRAFEAIARLGSVTLAAQELAISPSAVSHQLKVLEGYLQMPLTERQGAGWC